MCIWSQPNDFFSLKPAALKRKNDTSSEINLRDKFAPYWSKQVQDLWTKLIDDILDKNPKEWTGYLPVWSKVYQNIQSFEIS